MSKRHELGGRRFGKLVARYFVPIGSGENPRVGSSWMCDCDCGKTNHQVKTQNLLKGLSRTCGCSHRIGFTCNETRFQLMNTPDEAYWLGFLFTDGCINTKKGSVHLSLSLKDIGHVKKFAKFFGSDRQPLETPPKNRGKYTDSGHASFAMCSRKISDSLVATGMHDAKTWSIVPWDGQATLMPHFWRGCIDGDGCIRNAEGKRNRRVSIELCGNEKMVKGFDDYVFKHTGCRGSLSSREPNSQHAKSLGVKFWRVRWTDAPRCKSIVRVLQYESAETYLDRKKSIGLSILQLSDHRKIAGSNGENHSLTLSRDQLIECFKNHGSWTGVAKSFGLASNNMTYHIDKHKITESEICEYRKKPFNNGKISKFTLKELEEMKSKFGTWSSVAIHLGVTQGSFSLALNKKRKSDGLI